MWTWFKKFLTKKPKHEFSEKQLDQMSKGDRKILQSQGCLLYTSPSPRDS